MNMIKSYIYTGIGTFFTTQSALAQSLWESQVPVVDGLKPDYGDQGPVITIQNFIAGLLTFHGVIMIIMTLWGGWKILTSGTSDEGKEAGKKIIINAVIGIVVIFFAWTITSLVFGVLAGGGTTVK